MKTRLDDFDVLVPVGHQQIERIPVKILLRWREDAQVWVLTQKAHHTIDSAKSRRIREIQNEAAWRHADTLTV